MKKKTQPTRFNFPHKLYILMRNDIASMNPGKAMAQACHAANQFVHEYGDNEDVKHWQKEGKGFGTTIVLSVDSPTFKDTMMKAMQLGVRTRGLVFDTTYPFITNKEIAELIPTEKLSAPSIFKEDGRVVMFRNELTCGYLFVVDGSSKQEEIVGALPLHP